MTPKDRPLWRTVKVRFGDIEPGDVTRDKYKKWNTVVSVSSSGPYTSVRFDSGVLELRSVHLVELQEVKPS